MAGKVVKINADLYKEIVKTISKSDFKYRYPSISSFINDAIYSKLKEIKQKSIFRIKI